MGLHIAHVSATFPPYYGGTGNVCYHNVRELARRGHDVHVFTARHLNAPLRERRENVTINRLQPLMRVGNAPVLVGLLGALRHFDIIHLHYPFFGGELAGLAAHLTRTPLVVTYHQDVLLRGWMGVAAVTLRQTLGRLTLRNAAGLLFTSLDYAAASHVRPMLRGREQHIGELPNGVDIAAFTPDASPPGFREQHGIAPDDHIVLLVAGLDQAHYFKGVNIFLQALAQLPTNVKGVIVGDGNLRNAYEATADTLGIGSRVVFAKRVSSADLVHYYQMADVTALPSETMGEAFGLVLIESMACGTPVVASNLPGVRTVVQHDVDGLLIKPSDPAALAAAVRQLLHNDTVRKAMGQNGRHKVEACFTWEQLAVRLETLYYQVRRGQGLQTSLSAADRS
ncbi:MAG: glycosyltransferase family 4 protein [Herpetosiphon sp.]